MRSRATPGARRPRQRVVGALVAVGLALSALPGALAQLNTTIPDLRAPPPRVGTAPRAGEPCDACGRIVSISEVKVDRSRGVVTALENPGPGTADPGAPSSSSSPLVGAVVYLPLGGRGADRPYVGGVGTPEMYARLRETTYEIAVRMSDGSYRLVRRADGTLFAVGDRVRWLGGDEIEVLVN